MTALIVATSILLGAVAVAVVLLSGRRLPRNSLGRLDSIRLKRRIRQGAPAAVSWSKTVFIVVGRDGAAEAMFVRSASAIERAAGRNVIFLVGPDVDDSAFGGWAAIELGRTLSRALPSPAAMVADRNETTIGRKQHLRLLTVSSPAQLLRELEPLETSR
jgi:hypothetical protein